ncbi:MAG: flagellar basal-body MS-ring/collar protein FliF [Sphingomonadales bacterium]
MADIAPPAALALPPPLADMAARAGSLWASPAVKRARPALLGLGVAAAALLALTSMGGGDWKPLYPGMAEADAAAVDAALTTAGLDHRINASTGSVEVPADSAAQARILLAGQGLPKAARPGDALAAMPLGASRSVEAARLRAALESDLAASVEAIDGVQSARVHVASATPSVFLRDNSPPSASVFVALAPGRTLAEAQVRAIVWLVATSVPGLAADKVSVVDQSGALLSAGATGDAQHLAYQSRLETLAKERLAKLLTPLLGAGHFTAEVAADIDFSRNEATSERFQPAGTLKTEQASRSMEAAPPPAQGIPGATSNTAPAAAQLSATPPATPAAPATPPNVTQEQTNRLWDIGKDVTVTQGQAPRLARLSVAVVIDAGVLSRTPAADIANLNRLVKGAIGFDANRGDMVEVQARRFAPAEAPAPTGFLDRPEVRDYGPLALGGLVLLLALVGGVIWWRRRKAVPAAVPAPASTGPDSLDAAIAAAMPSALGPQELGLAAFGDGPAGEEDGDDIIHRRRARGIDYSGKLGQARQLVMGDGDRAMAVARQMLADARQEAPAP